jgi:hypothetical protein
MTKPKRHNVPWTAAEDAALLEAHMSSEALKRRARNQFCWGAVPWRSFRSVVCRIQQHIMTPVKQPGPQPDGVTAKALLEQAIASRTPLEIAWATGRDRLHT